MKKTLTILAVTVLCLCLLAGCGCRHEWTEADCLTAKTCSKCQITEGEALGHDFADATCTAARTCSRCQITEGEALGHDFADATCTAAQTCTRCALIQGEKLSHEYGQWTVNETDMTRACEHCGDVESSEIDREVVLNQMIRGHWDFVVLYQNGQAVSAGYLPGTTVGPYMRFTDSGEHIFFGGDQELSCTLEFQSYETVEDNEIYYALLVFENGDKTSIALQSGEQNLLILFTGADSYIGYTKNDQLNAALACSWAASYDDGVYILNLNEDHTFRADFDGEITGTWHLRPVTSSYGYRSCTLSMRYLKDGAPVVVAGQIGLGPDSVSLEQYLAPNQHFSLNMYAGERYLSFNTATEEEIAALKAAQEEGKAKLTGSWISRSVDTYHQNTQSNDVVLTGDYSMTFAEDGTFSAVMDQERSGTWSFREATISYGNLSLSYELTFDGIDEKIHAYINNDGELSFSHYQNGESKTVHLVNEADYAQWEKLQAEGSTKILGTWNSTSTNVRNNNDGTASNKTALDYTIAFGEDGTFTASIDRDYTGTWKFSDTYTYNNGMTDVTSYNYILSFEGIPHTVSATVDANRITLRSYENNISYNIDFVQMSQADLDQLRKGPALIEGSWKAVSGDPGTTGYTMTVNADGTFTAFFGETVTGTWTFEHYDAEEGHQYLFYLDNSDGGYMFNIQDEKNFHIWVEQGGGQYVSAVMNKA